MSSCPKHRQKETCIVGLRELDEILKNLVANLLVRITQQCQDLIVCGTIIGFQQDGYRSAPHL